MIEPLMPKATAIWLVDNTALTFEQIADFCHLHPLEVQALADGDISSSMVGQDPTLSGQLTREEIIRCEKDSKARLQMNVTEAMQIGTTQKAKYRSVSKRATKPSAILWLLRTYPQLPDTQIKKLIGTTSKTIATLRDKTYPNIQNLKPQNPVGLGLCTEAELQKAVAVSTPRGE